MNGVRLSLLPISEENVTRKREMLIESNYASKGEIRLGRFLLEEYKKCLPVKTGTLFVFYSAGF